MFLLDMEALVLSRSRCKSHPKNLTFMGNLVSQMLMVSVQYTKVQYFSLIENVIVVCFRYNSRNKQFHCLTGPPHRHTRLHQIHFRSPLVPVSSPSYLLSSPGLASAVTDLHNFPYASRMDTITAKKLGFSNL